MPLYKVLSFLVPIKEQEVAPVLYSFASLFSILTSYFLLLPLREDAGISLGTSTLPKLFACSLLVTLVVTPAVTAYLNSKGHAHGRDAALRHFYRCMAAILLGFFVLYNFSMVEGWVDRASLVQRQLQLPFHTDQLAQPSGSALQQQQLLQQPPERHAQQHALDGAVGSTAAGLLRPSTEGSAHEGPEQQDWQMPRVPTSTRHLLQALNTHRVQAEAAAASITSDSSSQDSGDSSSSSGSSSSRVKKVTVSGRTGDATLTKHQRLLRASFYVWVNVMNLVGISSLWAKCADAFSPEAGARLFGFISAGATLGQLTGSLTAMLFSWVAGMMLDRMSAGVDGHSSGSSGGGGFSDSRGHGSIRGTAPASGLLLFAAVLQLVAAQLVTRIRPVAGPSATAAGAAGAPNAASFAHKLDVVGGSSSNSTGIDRSPLTVLVRRSGSFSGGSRGPTGRAGAAKPSGPLAAAVLEPQGINTASVSAAANGMQGTLVTPVSTNGSSNSYAAANGGSSGSRDDRPAAAFQLQKVLTGFQMIWHSPYLLLVCSNLLLTYVVGSLMYFQRALVVSAAAAVHGPTYRTAFFAALNTWSAAAILLVQLFATSSLLRAMGMTAALGLAPAICLSALLGIAACPLPWMVAVSEVVRKVFGYAVLRPTREVLFTVVSREEKYSAKLVIDTIIQRLGDALAAAVFQVLDVQYNFGQAGVGAAGCVMCVMWIMTALALGRQYKQMANSGSALHV